jgi:hypothetical protein
MEVKYMSTRIKKHTVKPAEYIENRRELNVNTADPHATRVLIREIGLTAFDNETVH